MISAVATCSQYSRGSVKKVQFMRVDLRVGLGQGPSQRLPGQLVRPAGAVGSAQHLLLPAAPAHALQTALKGLVSQDFCHLDYLKNNFF